MMNKEKHEFKWLYVDFNSFFASIEQQMDYSLRRRPVAVIPVLSDTATIIAASIEAKRYGVKTGTRVGEAKRLCPKIIFRLGEHRKYVEFHEKILAALDKILPVSSIGSIDEMACALMGREQTEVSAVRLAQEIKKIIRLEVGDYLTCSIGLAPNKYLAKVATDMKKPDGLILIKESDLPRRLFGLKPRDFPGIGEKTEARIHRFGIRTVEELFTLSESEMRRVWGSVSGEKFYWAIRGKEWQTPERDQQTIGHSHVLPPEYRNREKCLLVAQKLLHKTAVRLRKNQMVCGEIMLNLSFLGQTASFAKRLKLQDSSDHWSLLEGLKDLWSSLPSEGTPLKVGVVLSKLKDENQKVLSLFENRRHHTLSQTIDAINEKYGRDQVSFASMQALNSVAPDRIAFGNFSALKTGS